MNWIDCKKQLPAPNLPVLIDLCDCDGGIVTIAHLAIDDSDGIPIDDPYYKKIFNGKCMAWKSFEWQIDVFEEVKRWMPLPKSACRRKSK